MRLDPTTAAGVDSPMAAALAMLAERDPAREAAHPLLDLSQAAPPYPPAPEVVERFKEVVLLPGDKPMTPAEYTAFVGEFSTLWAGVSKSAGIELELG